MKRLVGLLAAGTLAGAGMLLAQGPGAGPGRGCGGPGCAPCPQQQSGAKAPIASNPVVEFKGKITKVQIARGQGMPFVEVEQGGKTERVVLGSMRYLMDHDFSPKAGDEISVKGYRTASDVYASSVTLNNGTALALRDAAGWPVWAGRGGMGMGRGMGRRGPCWQ